MKLVNQYIIPHKGLPEGEHVFNFEIGETFFEAYATLEIRTGAIHADVLLNKKSNFIELSVKLKGNLEIQCDRCLEYFNFPLSYSGDLYVKFKETPEEPDDEVIFLHPSEDLLDLEQFFVDSIGLSIPIQKFHPKNADETPGCNADMLAKLDEHTYNVSSEKEETIDPRWAKLNDLLNKGNKNE